MGAVGYPPIFIALNLLGSAYMSQNPSFSAWLGTLFGHSSGDIQRLLKDKAALHFLIAWSLFESKCFGGFVQAKNIKVFAQSACSSIEWQVLRTSKFSTIS